MLVNRVLSIAIGLVLFGYAAAILLIGPYAWDDGAITVSFGRTLMQEGVIALTGASERVEGSSSLLYTILTGLPFLVADWPMPTSVFIAQFLTLGLLVLLLILTNVALAESLPDPLHRRGLLLLLSLQPMVLAEIANAMEMLAFANLFVLFSIAYQRRSPLLYLVILGLLMCRFEAVFYLGVGLLVMFLFVAEDRAYHFRLGVATLVMFGLLTVWRYMYFGDIFPNTVWAKMHPPYSNDVGLVDSLRGKLEGVTEFLTVNFAMLLMMAAAALMAGGRSLLSDIRFWLVVGFILFAFVTGSNQGYDGRMFLGLLPVLLILIVALPAEAVRRSVVFGLAALALVGTLYQNRLLVGANIWLIAKGAYFQEYLPESVSARLADRFTEKTMGATPERYRRVGARADRIRQALGLETLRFSAPDVGGLGLCCDPKAIEVIDSALLTNQTLAHEGYGAFVRILTETPPDLIAIHAWWAENPRIYDLAPFRAGYQPIIHDNTLFWIRAAHLESLRQTSGVTITPVADGFDLTGLNNDLRDHDLAKIEELLGSGKVLSRVDIAG